MNFLPKEIEDIIVDYKEQLEYFDKINKNEDEKEKIQDKLMHETHLKIIAHAEQLCEIMDHHSYNLALDDIMHISYEILDILDRKMIYEEIDFSFDNLEFSIKVDLKSDEVNIIYIINIKDENINFKHKWGSYSLEREIRNIICRRDVLGCIGPQHINLDSTPGNAFSLEMSF